ncbi:MAG TPA: dihydrodipicolinate synthase family protein [Gaiellaceae bacterium]|nr:dihydrodipicolinate synthase family protein [Gaiellaceae bacterium]
MLHGALAAAVTPLAGERLDDGAFGPYVDFLVRGGLDGLLALGTNGEGILLSVAERRRAVELFVAAADGRLQVAAHCGARLRPRRWSWRSTLLRRGRLPSR